MCGSRADGKYGIERSNRFGPQMRILLILSITPQHRSQLALWKTVHSDDDLGGCSRGAALSKSAEGR